MAPRAATPDLVIASAAVNLHIGEVSSGGSEASEGERSRSPMHGATMADLANLCMFFSDSLDRGVIDKTGIAGMFDIHLELSPDASGDAAEPSTSTDSIFVAVHKLGLKLELTKGPAKFLVIDHVERPSLTICSARIWRYAEAGIRVWISSL